MLKLSTEVLIYCLFNLFVFMLNGTNGFFVLSKERIELKN